MVESLERQTAFYLNWSEKSQPETIGYRYPINILKDGNSGDSLIEVRFDILKKNAPGDPLVYFCDTLNVSGITSDTVIVEIPEMPRKGEVHKYYREANRMGRRENFANHLSDVTDFLTYWEGSLLYGSYYQGQRSYFELMYGPAKVFWKMPHAPLLHSGPALGFEFNTRWQKDNFILGPKLGWQISTSIMNAGLHFVYYTDFDKGSLFLKPRIGINPLYSFINISYAYSIPLTSDYFGERINRHQLCLNFMIPVKK